MLLFAGAPTAETVCQSEILLDVFEPCYSRIDPSLPMRSGPDPGLTKPQGALKSRSRSSTNSPSLSTDTVPAAWRILSLTRVHLETGLSQGVDGGLPVFLNPAQLLPNPDAPNTDTWPKEHPITLSASQSASTAKVTSDILSGFYESSLLQYSLLGLPSAATASELTASLLSSADADVTHSPAPSLDSFRPGASRPISNVADIPTVPARSLNPESPQSPRRPVHRLVNLLVGIISISPARAITTRWGKEMRLAELLVGDETRAGFSISIWLPPSSAAEKSTLESTLEQLQRQDIVLLQNIALGTYMDKVFGQSVKGGDTSINLLYRHSHSHHTTTTTSTGLVAHYRMRDLRVSRDLHPQLDKTKKVFDWVINCVGRPVKRGVPAAVPTAGEASTKRQVRTWDMPPPDSEENVL